MLYNLPEEMKWICTKQVTGVKIGCFLARFNKCNLHFDNFSVRNNIYLFKKSQKFYVFFDLLHLALHGFLYDILIEAIVDVPYAFLKPVYRGVFRTQSNIYKGAFWENT